ncbi:MAG TPA: hypothetical protein EYP34_14245 [Chromatiaceae bacterium]|nr:hypothetical protein [Chromatiaceae bacterium]
MKLVACSLDPYDLWCTPFGIRVRELFYQGNLLGKLGALVIALVDWLLPLMSRKLLGAQPRAYPILSAHYWLLMVYRGQLSDCRMALDDLRSQVLGLPDMSAWGLGFPWMSKNGLYGPDVPFVTHTPYVMEALLYLAQNEECHDEAMEMFYGTWPFLESLKVMYEDGDRLLALSYAPVDEPRIVVNANSYAAFAHALHAVHGVEDVRELARKKSLHLASWVVCQQEESGRWWYYADRDPGNFVDGFHSCFVVKNLIKLRHLLPQVGVVVDDAIEKGWRYIREEIYSDSAGLCRRFAVRSHRDPYLWDLYDQAEYLGLLIDFGLLDEARMFADGVEQRFKKGEHWYCRIDMFGRRWGRDFLRWGIVPFWYHQARLARALKKETD